MTPLDRFHFAEHFGISFVFFGFIFYFLSNLQYCSICICIKIWVQFLLRAKCTRCTRTRDTDAGPRGHVGARGPQASLTGGPRARARHSATATASTGGVELARARERAHSMRKTPGYTNGAAPPVIGHRRQSTHQWRGGGLPNTRRRQPLTMSTLPMPREREKGTGRSVSSPRN
jgi:hypothetical protein